MIKEAYVSFEVAVMLKDKGFREVCNRYYNAQYNMIRSVSDTFMMDFNDEEHLRRITMGGAISIPTQQMVVAWLIEKYGIHLQVKEETFEETSADGYTVNNIYYRWCPRIILLHTAKIREGFVPLRDKMVIFADTMEQAIDEGIKWILTNIPLISVTTKDQCIEV